MCDEDIVILRSQDGEEFKVEVRVAKLSETIKEVIEDVGIEKPIPLNEITGNILRKVLEYSKHLLENPKGDNKDITTWEEHFLKVDQTTLFEMILAANYLNSKELLDLTCESIAKMIRGKTPEQIRKVFNIKNDFTAEEEEQVKKENEWVEKC